MNKKRMAVGAIALTAIAVSAVVISPAFAYRGDYTQKGSSYTEGRHAQMEEAFANNDYEAWKNLMDGRGRVTEVVDEGNFDKFVEAHKFGEEGNYDEADKIREELGLRTRNGEPRGEGYGQGNGKGNGNGEGGGHRGMGRQ